MLVDTATFWGIVGNASAIATLSSEVRNIKDLHNKKECEKRLTAIGRQIDWSSVPKDMELHFEIVDSYISSQHKQIQGNTLFSDSERHIFIDTFYSEHKNFIYYREYIDPILIKYLNELESFLIGRMSLKDRLIYKKLQIIEEKVDYKTQISVTNQFDQSMTDNVDLVSKINFITKAPSGLCSEYVHRDVICNKLFSSILECHFINLYSIGGLGKTELTKQLVQCLRDGVFVSSEIQKIAWIQYVSNDFVLSLQNSFYAEMEWIDFQEICEEEQEKLLVIIDDVEKIDDKYLKKLSSLSCNILITSRIRKIASFTTIELPIMSNTEQKYLFYAYYDGEKQEGVLDKVLKLACAHTITIEFLAKLAQYNDWNIDFLYKKLVEMGFRLSEVKIDSDHERLEAEASMIKHLAKLFEIIKYTSEEQYVLTCSSVMPNLAFSVSQACDWFQLNCGGILHKLFLIGLIESSRKSGKLVYWMHSVIAAAIRCQQKSHLYKMTKPLVAQMSNELEIGNQWGYEYKKVYLIPFCWAIYDLLGDNFNNDDDSAFLMRLCYIALEANNILLGYRLAARCLTLDENNSNWIAVVRDQIALGDAETRRWNPKEAIEHYMTAEKIFKEEVGESYEDYYQELSVIYHNLANALQQLDDYDEAIKYAFLSKNIQDQHDISDRREQSTCLSDIAMIYLAMGDLEEAYRYIQDAINIIEDFDENNSEDIMLYQYLADVLTDMGEYQEALELYEKVRFFREKNYDEYNENLADFYLDYAICLSYADKHEYAVTYAKKAIRTFLYNDGKHSVRHLRGCNTYALTLKNAGRIDEACAEYEKILQLNEEVPVLSEIDMVTFSTNYVETLIFKDSVLDEDIQNALLINQRMDKLFHSLHMTHPQLHQNIMENYAEIYSIQKNPMAIDYYEYLCAHCIDESERLTLKLHLICCHMEQEDYAEVREIIDDMLQLVRDNPDYLFEEICCYGYLSLIEQGEAKELMISKVQELSTELDDETQETINDMFLVNRLGV